MLPFQVSKPRESLNIAYRFQKVMKRDYDLFKSHLALYFNNIDEQESEEHNKNSIAHFLKNVWYDTSYTVNSRRRTDLAISLPYGNPKPVGAFFEMKTPGNTAEMPTAEKPNCKALQQLLLYYLDLRIEDNQHQLCRLVITNAYDWYLFDSTWWETHIYQNKTLIKQYQDYKRSGHNTPYFYDSIAKPFFNALETPMPCTYFNLKDYKQALENDQPEVLVVLYKILSPAHLLKQPFANDSNSLDTGFYHELLYITGLEEQKIKGQIKIVRRKNTIPASLLEQVYAKLDSKNCLKKIEQPQNYGANKEEQLFHLSLELCLTWLNRILFIKLLDSQIKGYHKEETEKGFLHSDTLNEFADVNDLFFEVLAKPLQQRQPHIAQKFSGVPYLNSSLFERTALEAATIEIDVLQNNVELPIWQHTVLKDSNGKKLDGSKRLLPYIIAFLDAYDFSSESKSAIQQNNKNLIGASVLGLIFEKINGYKDGSHFTPGAVTSYMCRETIRRAVLQKFREKEQYSECANFEQLYNKINRNDLKEANKVVNSLRVCDPAVGSGHFLVSALNEILAIKHDLGILTDRNGKWLRGYELEISNDYLITSYDGELLEYNPNNTESRRVQEALFHEKQTIIENCLFGVDINPNSVKICRLRLWIELLKHTYYTAESKYKELETLPNIDINIKTGDSLLSRFKLDADLSQALKQSKWNIDSYKLAVNAYKNAKNYDEKHNLVALIQDIKDNFRTEIDRTHPLSQKLKKANDEHYNLLMQNGMYDDTPDERRAKIARKQKLQEEIAALTAQLEAIKNNKVYQNAFEWRFEFPEVLDSEGKFLGFDVVMGNPPYIDIKGHSPMLVRYYFDNYLTAENRINLYALMIERTWDLIKLNGFFSFIVPNSLLMNSTYSKLRNKLWTHVYEIIKLPDNIFSSGVKVETIIFSYQKEIEFEQSNVIKYKHNEPLTKIDPSIANSQSKNLWHINNEVKFNLYMQPMAYSLLNKLHDSATPIGDIADFSLGITPYDKHKGHTKEMIDSKVFHSEEKISDEYVPLIDGGSISKYYVNPEPVGYLKYGDWLGAPRERRFFTEPRVIVRQILPNSLSIFAASTSNEVYFNQIAFAIISKKLHPNYVSALLNSTLINFIHTNIYLDPEKVLFQKILIENCKKLPIKVISLEEQQPIIKLVNKIINAKKIDLKANTSEYETKLNNMIFQLYNITESDIKMIYALMKS